MTGQRPASLCPVLASAAYPTDPTAGAQHQRMHCCHPIAVSHCLPHLAQSLPQLPTMNSIAGTQHPRMHRCPHPHPCRPHLAQSSSRGTRVSSYDVISMNTYCTGTAEGGAVSRGVCRVVRIMLKDTAKQGVGLEQSRHRPLPALVRCLSFRILPASSDQGPHESNCTPAPPAHLVALGVPCFSSNGLLTSSHQGLMTTTTAHLVALGVRELRLLLLDVSQVHRLARAPRLLNLCVEGA